MYTAGLHASIFGVQLEYASSIFGVQLEYASSIFN